MSAPRIRACWIRVKIGPAWRQAIIPESREEMAARVGAPPWVLDQLNRAIDLDLSEIGESVLVPAMSGWRASRWCWTPSTWVDPNGALPPRPARLIPAFLRAVPAPWMPPAVGPTEPEADRDGF